jgi:hypothetical protein
MNDIQRLQISESMALGISSDSVSVFRHEERIGHALVSMEQIRLLLKRPGTILLKSPIELRSQRGSVEVRVNGRAFGNVSSVALSQAAFPVL